MPVPVILLRFSEEAKARAREDKTTSDTIQELLAAEGAKAREGAGKTISATTLALPEAAEARARDVVAVLRRRQRLMIRMTTRSVH